MRLSVQFLCLLLCGLFTTMVAGHPTAAAVTPEQRAKIAELEELTREAGRLYSGGELLKCVEVLSGLQSELITLLDAKDPVLQRLAKPIYARLAKAHSLLELQGAELEPLPSWSDLTAPAKPPPPSGSMSVSFKRDVAPWLVTACGNCHIEKTAGQFSIATFEALMKGTRAGVVLFPGSSRGSRIVEVIESGDMPRGGGKVTPQQLAVLKKWIDEGAELDAPDAGATLTSYASGESTGSTTEPQPMMSSEPTGAETVSFAKDIAPILRENCNGCHIAGMRASGNLRMDTFAQLLRGGDSGAAVEARNAAGSLLIQKLKGESGQRMPAGGRSPLAADKIALISTWVAEGASFDGPSPNSNIDVVINQAWAEDATHEELFERREQRALDRWTRILPGDAPATAKTDEVLVLGNVSPARIEETLATIGGALKLAKKSLQTPTKDPLVKGGITVFVLKSRYDYSEFGRMTENRELPKHWLGHWKADPLDVYAVLADEADSDEKQQAGVALQIIAGAAVGRLSDVPTWFAEGVARNLVVSNFKRGDSRVSEWESELPAAVAKVDNAKVLLEGRLDDEAAGLVGMGVTRFMMDRSNRRRFDKLLELLHEGRSFEEAMTFAFAPPETLVKSWLGK